MAPLMRIWLKFQDKLNPRLDTELKLDIPKSWESENTIRVKEVFVGAFNKKHELQLEMEDVCLICSNGKAIEDSDRITDTITPKETIQVMMVNQCPSLHSSGLNLEDDPFNLSIPFVNVSGEEIFYTLPLDLKEALTSNEKLLIWLTKNSRVQGAYFMMLCEHARRIPRFVSESNERYLYWQWLRVIPDTPTAATAREDDHSFAFWCKYLLENPDPLQFYSPVGSQGQIIPEMLSEAFAKILADRLCFHHFNRDRTLEIIEKGELDCLNWETTCKPELDDIYKEFLPASFIGGPRYLEKRKQDLFAFVREYGNPQALLTIRPCPKENAENEPYQFIKEFESKLSSFVQELQDGLLGLRTEVAYFVSFLEGGMPTARVFVFLEQEHATTGSKCKNIEINAKELSHRFEMEILCQNTQHAEQCIKDTFEGGPVYRTQNHSLLSIFQRGCRDRIDEIRDYIEERFISPCEGAWGILDLKIYFSSINVEHLAIHLPNEDLCDEKENSYPNTSQNRTEPLSQLQAFFKLCGENMQAQKVTYENVPKRFRWNSSDLKWEERGHESSKTIGRLYTVAKCEGERYFLSLLLKHVKGPTGFRNIRTFNGVVHKTFKDACISRCLVTSEEADNFPKRKAPRQNPSFDMSDISCTFLKPNFRESGLEERVLSAFANRNVNVKVNHYGEDDNGMGPVEKSWRELGIPTSGIIRKNESGNSSPSPTSHVGLTTSEINQVTSYLELCVSDLKARKYKFNQFVLHYDWNENTCRWRKKSKSKQKKGKPAAAKTPNPEQHFLSELLQVVRGPTCDDDLRTFNGVIYQTYSEACHARGIF